MKRLDLILNGKGGVGKSFFAVNFVQFLKDKGLAHIAIDSDNENSTLKRFHPDTRFLDLDSRRELDGIFAALEKAKNPPEWLADWGEDHGIFNDRNRIEAYERMLAFFAKHLASTPEGAHSPEKQPANPTQ